MRSTDLSVRLRPSVVPCALALARPAITRSDHCAFQLREDTDHLEHGPAGRRRSIEALLVQIEVHVQGMEVFQEAREVMQRTAQSIHRPRCHHVEPTARRVLTQGGQARDYRARGSRERSFFVRHVAPVEELPNRRGHDLRRALVRKGSAISSSVMSGASA